MENFGKTQIGFVDSLVSLFTATPAVTKAYFGMLYNEEEERDDLFLAVEHSGELEKLQSATEKLRETYLPDLVVSFVSSAFQPDLLYVIEQKDFPFYDRDKPQLLNVAIMKHWFDPMNHRREFVNRVTTGTLTSLFTDFQPRSKVLNFQTYVRRGKEFIPLFSEREMVYKSGMRSVPPELTVAEFAWKNIGKSIDTSIREHFYVLNPGTSFEVEFNV